MHRWKAGAGVTLALAGAAPAASPPVRDIARDIAPWALALALAVLLVWQIAVLALRRR